MCCPVCGAGPFAMTTVHIAKVHRIMAAEQRRRGWHVMSVRAGERPIDIDTDKPYENFIWRRELTAPRRHKAWLQAIAEEIETGDFQLRRLAKRWRVSENTAAQRLHHLREIGHSVPLVRALPRKTCRRGHVKDPCGTGRTDCRECVRLRLKQKRRWENLTQVERDARREYMRDYMRKRRAQAPKTIYVPCIRCGEPTRYPGMGHKRLLCEGCR